VSAFIRIKDYIFPLKEEKNGKSWNAGVDSSLGVSKAPLISPR
jgi:hypothetical protein